MEGNNSSTPTDSKGTSHQKGSTGAASSTAKEPTKQPSVYPAIPVAPATRPPAVPTPVMPVSAPVPTKTAVAAPIASASTEADPYGQGASSLVAGSTLEENVQTILEMGGGAWDRETAVRALRSAFNNLERAVEYLYSGVPEQPRAPAASQVLSASGQPADPVQAPMSQAQIAPSGANANPLELFPQAPPTQTVVLNPVPEATAVLSSTSLANISSDAVADSQVVSNNELPSPPNSNKASHQTAARVKRRKVISDSASDSSPPPPANCAKCRSHKRKCHPGCVFAPIFHVDQQSEYELISKVFGVRCMEKLLEKVNTYEDRLLVRGAMLYAAEVWEINPVRGTHGVVQRLEMENAALKEQLALVSQHQHQPAAEPAGDDAPNAEA